MRRFHVCNHGCCASSLLLHSPHYCLRWWFGCLREHLQFLLMIECWVDIVGFCYLDYNRLLQRSGNRYTRSLTSATQCRKQVALDATFGRLDDEAPDLSLNSDSELPFQPSVEWASVFGVWVKITQQSPPPILRISKSEGMNRTRKYRSFTVVCFVCASFAVNNKSCKWSWCWSLRRKSHI